MDRGEDNKDMSVSGNIAMSVLRLIKPGRDSFTDLKKMREKAHKENAAFRFSMPVFLESKRSYNETLALIEQL